ncbi:ribonuclease P [Malassezia sp. CBS 17886]|nr:ribonuclease P [Malassezia sp. CBS 17886]
MQKRAAGRPADDAPAKRARCEPSGDAGVPRPGRTPAAHAAIAPSAAVPSQLVLDEAIAARKADILALHRAMLHARETTNTRAWQLLPRSLRRRAASHNLLRLPVRLRGKARAELRASNTTALSKSDLRRRAVERTRLGWLRRRRSLMRRAARPGRAWLETHLWHAKRFRMSGEKRAADGGSGRWGFVLAESPHQKSFRSSWRAAKRYATLHDASYAAVFRLRARHEFAHKAPRAQPTRRLQLLLYFFGASHGWEDEWCPGARRCTTVLLGRPQGRARASPSAPFLSAVAPIDVLWVPGDTPHYRECLIMAHPAAAADIQSHLTQALDAMHAEQRRARRHPTPIPQDWSVHVQIGGHALDMAPPPALATGTAPLQGRRTRRAAADVHAPVSARDAAGFNVFYVCGQEATRLMGGVLRQVPPASDAPAAEVTRYRRVQGILCQNPAETDAKLPSGAVFYFDVYDPRLSFPPKNALRAVHEDRGGASHSPSAPHEPPTLHPAVPPLDVLVPPPHTHFFQYHGLPRLSKGDIDSRRAKSLRPGAPLAPTDEDDRVPIVLIRETVQEHPDGHPLRGYVLLVPRGWSVAFWLSLVHTGAKVMGQEQLHQQRLHLNLMTYPYDWVNSPAYRTLETRAAQLRHDAWHRRPPAKRVNYAVGEAFHPHPFGGMLFWAWIQESACATLPEHVRSSVAAQIARAGTHLSLHMVPSAYTRECRETLQGLMRCDLGTASLAPPASAALWRRQKYVHGFRRTLAPAVDMPLRWLATAVVPVVLTACRKGAFEELATVYLPQTLADVRAWRAALDPRTAEKAAAAVQLQKLESEAGDVSRHPAVGGVTSGDYSLDKGKGHAVACLSLVAWLELERREAVLTEETPPKVWGARKRNPVPLAFLVLVHNLQGKLVRAAAACQATVHGGGQ